MKLPVIDFHNTVTLQQAVRVLIIALVIFAGIVTILGFFVINSFIRINQERHDRFIFVNNQINALACVLVEHTPDSADPRVHKFRHDHHCPPYTPLKK